MSSVFFNKLGYSVMPVEATSMRPSWLSAMSNKNMAKAGIKLNIAKLTKIKWINYYTKYESYIYTAETTI